MLFYCPNCQKEYDVPPRETITTLQHRLAYKATCPVCGQDMAEFIPPASPSGGPTPPAGATPPVISPVDIPANVPVSAAEQATLDQAAQDLAVHPVPDIPPLTPPTPAGSPAVDPVS